MNPQFKNSAPDGLAVAVFLYAAQPHLHDAADLAVNPVKEPAAERILEIGGEVVSDRSRYGLHGLRRGLARRALVIYKSQTLW